MTGKEGEGGDREGNKDRQARGTEHPRPFLTFYNAAKSAIYLTFFHVP
jgi:hypothetical protein